MPQKKSVSAKISSDNTIFAASGMKIIFPGYLRVYVEAKIHLKKPWKIRKSCFLT